MSSKSNEKTMLILVGAIAALWIGYLAVWNPLSAMWTDNQAQIEQLTKKVANARKTIQPQFKAKVNNTWKLYNTQALSTNNTQAVDDVVKAVDKWTRSSRFQRTALKPTWTIEQGDRGILEVHVTGQGNIEQIGKFLFELEHDPLALKIEEATVSATDPEGRNLTLSLRFTGLQIRKDTRPASGRASTTAQSAQTKGDTAS